MVWPVRPICAVSEVQSRISRWENPALSVSRSPGLLQVRVWLAESPALAMLEYTQSQPKVTSCPHRRSSVVHQCR